MQQANPIGSPDPQEPGNKAPSNARYRSFAERWVVERARLFRDDAIAEDSWKAAQDAKTAYRMIKEIGRTVGDDT